MTKKENKIPFLTLMIRSLIFLLISSSFILVTYVLFNFIHTDFGWAFMFGISLFLAKNVIDFFWDFSLLYLSNKPISNENKTKVNEQPLIMRFVVPQDQLNINNDIYKKDKEELN